MPEHNRSKNILIGAMTVAMLVVSVVYYSYRNFNVSQTSSSLTNAEEEVLQQQLAKIVASKKIADCATLANVQYRRMCEQVLSASVQRKGTPLPASVTQPTMTNEQLIQLVKNSSLQPSYSLDKATTTP